MNISSKAKRFAALALSLSLLLGLLSACGGDRTEATAMRLKRTQGAVGVSDGAGKSLEPAEDLGLYDGYRVDTQGASYAWIDLDEVKLTKMDENSDVAIQKEGTHLTIEVKSGSLYFNITEPLTEDETLDIRTSTMLVGIRGTRGWVRGYESTGWMELYLLEGKVECSVGGNTAVVTAGEMASMSEDGDIVVAPFPESSIPDFVLAEDRDGEAEPSSPAGPDSTPPGDGEDPDVIASGYLLYQHRDSWTLSRDGVLTCSGNLDSVRFFRCYPDDIVAEAARQTGLPEDSITINKVVVDTSQMTCIHNNHFDGLDKLETIVIPDTVTEIGSRAFQGCTSLTSVTIPEGVTELGDWAFNGCESLTSVTLPSTLTKMGEAAFYGCQSLTSIVLPSGLTEIPERAFDFCDSLTSITIPRSVTTIAQNAFTLDLSSEIYYEGSESEWQAIGFRTPNYTLVHFNCPMP